MQTLLVRYTRADLEPEPSSGAHSLKGMFRNWRGPVQGQPRWGHQGVVGHWPSASNQEELRELSLLSLEKKS